MKKVLFTNGNSAAGGTLGPTGRMVAIAAAIKRQEPETEFLFRAAGSEKTNLEAHGFEVATGYEPTLFGLPRFLDRWINKSMEQKASRPIPAVKDMEFVLRLKGMLTHEYLERTLREELRLLEEYRPDCVYGSMDLLMPVAARKLDIPYVAIGSAIMQSVYRSPLFPDHKSKDYTPRINTILKKTGLPRVAHIRDLLFEYYATKVLVPSVAELEELPDDGRIVYCGSILPEILCNHGFQWEKTRPLIYVYLSVGQLTPSTYIKVLGETFADSPFAIIVAAGDHPYFRGRDHYAAGNVHFYRIVPSHKIIPLSDLVIHHGGQNSTMQAIRAGVPALIFPGLHFERYFNALKAAQAGCARLYGNEDFNPRVLRTAVETALADGLLKKNCAVYSRKLKAAGGNAKAARTLLHPNK